MVSARIPRLLEVVATLSGVVVYTSATGFMTGGLAVAGRELGISEIEIGAILGIGAFISVIVAPLWGMAAEIWSRRKLLFVIVPMLALAPVAMALICAYAPLFPVSLTGFGLGAARLLLAAFGAAAIPVAQAFIADLTTADHRVSGMGGLSAVVSSGTLIGSALLWITGSFGIVTGFATLAFFGVLASVLVFTFVPDTGPRPKLQADETVLPLAAISPYLAITFLGFLCYTIVPPIFALRLIDRFGLEGGAATAQTGFVLTIGVLAVCFAQALIAMRFKWNVTTMLRGGTAGILLGLGLLFLAGDIVEMGAAMGIIGLAVGFIAPANLGAISLAAGRGAQAKAGGLNMAARGLGSAAGPMIGTMLYRVSADAPIIGSMVLVAILLLLTFLVPTPRHRKPVDTDTTGQPCS